MLLEDTYDIAVVGDLSAATVSGRPPVHLPLADHVRVSETRGERHPRGPRERVGRRVGSRVGGRVSGGSRGRYSVTGTGLPACAPAAGARHGAGCTLAAFSG